MKNLSLVCFAATILLIASCSKDEDNPVAFDKSKAEIVVSKTATVMVKGGDGTYTAVSSDSNIATVKLSGKEMTITAVKIGSATITVKDKAGKAATLPVAVVKDPYEAVKADSKIRFVWNTISKIEGTDKGAYLFTQATDGKVQFSWKSEDLKNSCVLSFSDKVGSITEGVKKDAVLLVDGKAVAVTSLEVIQTKIVKEGEKATTWVAFSATSKVGICVGKLAQ